MREKTSQTHSQRVVSLWPTLICVYAMYIAHDLSKKKWSRVILQANIVITVWVQLMINIGLFPY